MLHVRVFLARRFVLVLVLPVLLACVGGSGAGLRAQGVEVPCAPDAPSPFLPGDSDRSGSLELTDPVMVFVWQLLGGPVPDLEASDVTNDGWVDFADPQALLAYLFGRGAPPALGTLPVPSCNERLRRAVEADEAARPLSASEQDALLHDARFADLEVLAGEFFELSADLVGSRVVTVARAGRAVSVTLVPLVSAAGGAGAVFLAPLGSAGTLAFAMIRDPRQGTLRFLDRWGRGFLVGVDGVVEPDPGQLPPPGNAPPDEEPSRELRALLTCLKKAPWMMFKCVSSCLGGLALQPGAAVGCVICVAFSLGECILAEWAGETIVDFVERLLEWFRRE